MRRLVTGKRAKEIDAYTMQVIGIPSMVLMERAALGAARAVKKRIPAGTSVSLAHPSVLAVCGTGNNGADGVAAARMLRLAGYDACAAIIGDVQRGTEEFKAQLEIAGRVGVPILGWQQMGERAWDAVIDAVFGVGLSREVEGDYRLCIERMNSLTPAPSLRLAVDIPSGIHGDTGRVMGAAFRADVTVTFGWEKQGTLLYPGREYAGEVQVEDIGFPAAAIEEAPGTGGSEEEGSGHPVFTYGPEDLDGVPVRKAYSNKGSFGKVLIVAGSRGMCGAAYLSALGAYRTGAGLVKILTVEENRQTLQMLLPEAILALYDPADVTGDREEFGRFMEEQTSWADVVVLGPGLGGEPYVEYLAEAVLTSAFVPVIVDADGLNAIAAHPYLTSYYTENIVITPHLGEMARLTGQSIGQIQENLPAAAMKYAIRYGITCVLKDAATVAAGREGNLYINSSGSSAMAKAGSGDVLTGVIAGLMALGVEEERAAFLGVYIHGLAGEKAGGESHSLLASELADGIREVLPYRRK